MYHEKWGHLGWARGGVQAEKRMLGHQNWEGRGHNRAEEAEGQEGIPGL